MLKISLKQYQNIGNINLQKLANKIDIWLCDELSNWKKLEQIYRQKQLSLLIKKAQKSGMRVETDYALFAWLIINQPTSTNAIFQRKDISALLNSASINSAGKLFRLEQLIKQHAIINKGRL